MIVSNIYNLRKVDTHVHSSSMNQKQLSRFIKAKIMKHSANVGLLSLLKLSILMDNPGL